MPVDAVFKEGHCGMSSTSWASESRWGFKNWTARLRDLTLDSRTSLKSLYRTLRKKTPISRHRIWCFTVSHRSWVFCHKHFTSFYDKPNTRCFKNHGQQLLRFSPAPAKDGHPKTIQRGFMPLVAILIDNLALLKVWKQPRLHVHNDGRGFGCFRFWSNKVLLV